MRQRLKSFFFASWRLGVGSLCLFSALCVTTAAQVPLEFEVASFKVHSPDPGGSFSSSMRTLPNGQIVMTNMTVRTIIGRAYPSRGSTQVLGLPSWTENEHYDVIVKANRPVSPDEQQEMWRALLADRMKLQAHYEPREEASFDLVFARADRRLGPSMKPSTCTPPPAPAPGTSPPPPPARPPSGADVMARCSGFLWMGNNIFAPRTTIGAFANMLRSGAGRIVVDKTGLEGFYDIEFSYADPRPRTSDAPGDPANAPDFFTAVQELGFKLEPSKTQVEVVVIDRVERPTEN
jgi:uncharacterized protein (TIGR03435 family)